MLLSVVIPCYNEAKNLDRLLDRLGQTFSGRTDCEVVLVDNGSTDDTAAVLDRELNAPALGFVRTVRVPVNRGYGFGIMSGLRAARGEYLGWTHADMQTDPKDVLDGFERLRGEAEPHRCLLRGRRTGRPLFDRAFTAGMSVVASALLGRRLRDVNAQPKIFHRSLLEKLGAAPDDFALDLYVLYRAQQEGLRLIEHPVNFARREAGEAKGGGTLRGKYRLTRRTWTCILNLRRSVRV